MAQLTGAELIHIVPVLGEQMQVERFFHVRRGNSTNGGATVRVVGDTERIGQVDVQVAYCHPLRFKAGKVVNPEDMFCKDVGRITATAKAFKVVPLRYLPAEMARIAVEVDRRAGTPTDGDWAQNKDWSFTLKYFLPKE
jgi:hypothetical protein